MFGKKFIGMFTAHSIAVKTIVLEDGSKAKMRYKKLVLETADIDYPELEEFNSNISATLLNIQPIPFEKIGFGDQSAINQSMKVYIPDPESEDEIDFESDDVKVLDLPKVMIIDWSINIKDNIPCHKITLDIPMMTYTTGIEEMIKEKIMFELNETK